MATGFSFLITWALFSAVNKQREIQYWEQQMSGLSYLIQKTASKYEGETKVAWLAAAFGVTGLPYEMVEKSDLRTNNKLKITKLKNSFQGTFSLDQQIVNFDFTIISKQFMEGINKLISYEIALNESVDINTIIDNMASHYSYPVQVVSPESISLSEFEKRQLNAPLIIFRFDDGISAISRIKNSEQLLKTGPVQPFNPFPSGLIIIACLILFFLTLALSMILIKPLEKRFSIFSSQVDKIKLNQKNIFNSVNIKQEGNDELAKLSENVDEMAKRIIQFAHDQQQMTRSVSHEIRTPLVKMNYRLARIESENLSQPQQKNIEGLKKNMGELDSLINELLLYSSLDRLPSPELIEIDMVKFLDEQIQKLLHLSDIKIQLQVKNERVLVNCFPNYLARILQNLLTNAQRYAKSTIVVSFTLTNNQFSLIVEDDGPGISKELATKIFEPFYVDDESRNSALNGHGLGLSIVSKMTELLNGEVEIVKSETLGGAKFILNFKS